MTRAKIAVVLGMHRSGTSAITEFVSSLGFAVPGEQLALEEEVNARGFWESQEVVDFNDALLQNLGLSWHSIKQFDQWETLNESYWMPMVDWLKGQLVYSECVVIKDPRINILLPVWKKILHELEADIHFINVNRHPDYVVQSINKRDGFGYAAGFALWINYILKPFEYPLNANCYFIDYERVINNRVEVLDGLTQFLEVDVMGDYSVVQEKLARNLLSIDDEGELATSARAIYQKIKEFSGSVRLDLAMTSELLDSVSGLYRLDATAAGVLDEVLNNLVFARRSMIDNGRAYSQALCVISDKDKGLEENKIYISQCNDRLDSYREMLHQLFSSLNSAIHVDNVHNIEFEYRDNAVDDNYLLAKTSAAIATIKELAVKLGWFQAISGNNSSEIVDNQFELLRVGELLKNTEVAELHKKNYIQQCHDHIKDLKAVIEEKVLSEEHNAAYIGHCHDEINRLLDVIRVKEQGELDNKIYIEKCHKEISRLHEVIAVKEEGERHNFNYIEQCHLRIAELGNELSRLAEEVVILNATIDDKDRYINSLRDEAEKVNSELNDLMDRYTKQVELVNCHVSGLMLMAEDFGIGVAANDFKNIELSQENLNTLRNNIISLLTDYSNLNKSFNRLITDFSRLTLRADRMEVVIARLKQHKLLALLNNKILNGL